MKKYAVIMAAGKGSRMKSYKPKVAHEILYKSMINHIIDEIKKTDIDKIFVVVGHESQKVMDLCDDDINFVFQKEQLGTAHAILQVAPFLEQEEGITLVLNGDAPLITAETINKFISSHIDNNNFGTIMTCDCSLDCQFGRVIKIDNEVAEIVEFKDLSTEHFDITEMSVGEYCFDNKELFYSLKNVNNNNAAKEYYLPDVFKIMYKNKNKIGSYKIDDLYEVGGINDKIELAKATKMLQLKINNEHMNNGVIIIDPNNTYISRDTSIGMDTIIEPGTIIKGHSVIGENCHIGPSCELDNVIIENNVEIKFSVISDSKIDNGVDIGPYARLRSNCHIKENVHMGNFVEMKNTVFGSGSKCAHLSYLGDSVVGNRVNIGCGTITVNYDGKNKFKTIIGDDAFIGCDANLVAPVTINSKAFIAAGSTITKDVEENALAVARTRQENKLNYAIKLEEKRNGRGN